MTELPKAHIRPRRHPLWLWILPLIALIVSITLLSVAWWQRGITLTIDFQQGYGLKAGDALRYRGIDVGRVQAVRLSDDLQQVQVTVQLQHSARDLARTGSQFWIVRPQLDINQSVGLDTLVGANYLGILPGEGIAQNHFVGREDIPLKETMPAGGLEITLYAPGLGALKRGAPVSYRQVIIGRLLDINLAKDASSVEVIAYIEPTYTSLVREQSHFWRGSGVQFNASIFSGISLEIGSIKSLLAGGITMAIPPNPGKPVQPGYRFRLFDEAEADWLNWTPYLATDRIDNLQLPSLLRVELFWQYNGYTDFWRNGKRQGWLLPVKGGLLGPADLLTEPAYAQKDSVRLTIGETVYSVQNEARLLGQGLAFLPFLHQQDDWPPHRTAQPDKPVETLVISGKTEDARHVSAESYTSVDNFYWQVNKPFTARWHGAAVVAADSGDLLGILLVEEQRVQVALIGDKLVEPAH